MKKEPILCDDCGDELERGTKRHHCLNCGLMVCGWCWICTHQPAREEQNIHLRATAGTVKNGENHPEREGKEF